MFFMQFLANLFASGLLRRFSVQRLRLWFLFYCSENNSLNSLSQSMQAMKFYYVPKKKGFQSHLIPNELTLHKINLSDIPWMVFNNTKLRIFGVLSLWLWMKICAHAQAHRSKFHKKTYISCMFVAWRWQPSLKHDNHTMKALSSLCYIFTFTNWREISVVINLNHFPTDYLLKSITKVSYVNISRTYKTPVLHSMFVCLTNFKRWWGPHSKQLIAFNDILCSITMNGSVNDIPPPYTMKSKIPKKNKWGIKKRTFHTL